MRQQGWRIERPLRRKMHFDPFFRPAVGADPVAKHQSSSATHNAYHRRRFHPALLPTSAPPSLEHAREDHSRGGAAFSRRGHLPLWLRQRVGYLHGRQRVPAWHIQLPRTSCPPPPTRLSLLLVSEYEASIQTIAIPDPLLNDMLR